MTNPKTPKKGKLLGARLGRAENLDEATRKKYNLPDEGLVVIETRDKTPPLKNVQEEMMLLKSEHIRKESETPPASRVFDLIWACIKTDYPNKVIKVNGVEQFNPEYSSWLERMRKCFLEVKAEGRKEVLAEVFTDLFNFSDNKLMVVLSPENTDKICKKYLGKSYFELVNQKLKGDSDDK